MRLLGRVGRGKMRHSSDMKARPTKMDDERHSLFAATRVRDARHARVEGT